MQDEDDSKVLDVIEAVVGKRVLLKMKRNEYNIRYPNSSISVTNFVICEDLMEQFDEADDDDQSGGDGGGGGAVVNKEVYHTKVAAIFS